MKISRWVFFVTETDFGEVQLNVVGEFVVLTHFQESFAGLQSWETIGRMEKVEDFDENLEIKILNWKEKVFALTIKFLKIINFKKVHENVPRKLTKKS